MLTCDSCSEDKQGENKPSSSPLRQARLSGSQGLLEWDLVFSHYLVSNTHVTEL